MRLPSDYFGNAPFCELMTCFPSRRRNWSFGFQKTQTVSLGRFSFVTDPPAQIEPAFEGQRPALIYERQLLGVQSKTLARETTNLAGKVSVNFDSRNSGRKFMSSTRETNSEM